MDNNKRDVIIPPTVDDKRIHNICMILDEKERNNAIWNYVHELNIPFVKILAKAIEHDWVMQVSLLLEQGMDESTISIYVEEKYIKMGKEYLQTNKKEVLELIK